MNGEDSLSVEVRFLKDNKDLWGTMRLTEKKNDIYANITFKDSMIRYADERFVNIELILEDESGLKIPKTSVTEKDCSDRLYHERRGFSERRCLQADDQKRKDDNGIYSGDDH